MSAAPTVSLSQPSKVTNTKIIKFNTSDNNEKITINFESLNVPVCAPAAPNTSAQTTDNKKEIPTDEISLDKWKIKEIESASSDLQKVVNNFNNACNALTENIERALKKEDATNDALDKIDFVIDNNKKQNTDELIQQFITDAVILADQAQDYIERNKYKVPAKNIGYCIAANNKLTELSVSYEQTLDSLDSTIEKLNNFKTQATGAKKENMANKISQQIDKLNSIKKALTDSKIEAQKSATVLEHIQQRQTSADSIVSTRTKFNSTLLGFAKANGTSDEDLLSGDCAKFGESLRNVINNFDKLGLVAKDETGNNNNENYDKNLVRNEVVDEAFKSITEVKSNKSCDVWARISAQINKNKLTPAESIVLIKKCCDKYEKWVTGWFTRDCDLMAALSGNGVFGWDLWDGQTETSKTTQKSLNSAIFEAAIGSQQICEQTQTYSGDKTELTPEKIKEINNNVLDYAASFGDIELDERISLTYQNVISTNNDTLPSARGEVVWFCDHYLEGKNYEDGELSYYINKYIALNHTQLSYSDIAYLLGFVQANAKINDENNYFGFIPLPWSKTRPVKAEDILDSDVLKYVEDIFMGKDADPKHCEKYLRNR